MTPESVLEPVRLAPSIRRMLAYGLPLLLGLAVALALVLQNDRTLRYQHGQDRARAMTAGAARELRSQLNYLERGLSGVAADAALFADIAPERASELLAARTAAVQRRNPDLQGIALLPALPDLPGLRATGADPARSAGHLRIGHPRQAAGIGWVLPLAQPIPGSTAGKPAWVFALLRISALEPIAAGLELGDNGIANILHRDGTLVVRSRDNARWVGASLRDSELVDKQMPLAPAGNYDLVSVLDGSKRMAAYRVLPDYPLVVTVGLAQREVLAGWTRFAVTATVLGGLLALLWLALLWVLVRSRGRRQALVDSLRRSAEQLAETRRIAGIGDWSWALDTGLVTWSPEIYQMQGLAPRPEPFHIDDIPQRIHPDDMERRKRDVAELVSGDKPMSEIQYRILRPDGEVRTIFARGEWSNRIPGQRLLRGIQQDITELSETRERLRAAQDQYRFLFQHNPMPMWVFDRETLAFLAVNDVMLANYGYAREELLSGSM
ncbi:MAG: PAS domain-containing protein, partial [Pseudomonadota bacterium]|nr:PAS domain-containing protein [Pseudomonadota bacterium]